MSEFYAHTDPRFPDDASKWEPLFNPECAALADGDCEKCERLEREEVRQHHRIDYDHLRPSASAALISSALRKLFISGMTSVVASIASRIRLRAASAPSVCGSNLRFGYPQGKIFGIRAAFVTPRLLEIERNTK